MIGGLTHEQYLDEPDETVDWMLQIGAIENEVSQEKRRG